MNQDDYAVGHFPRCSQCGETKTCTLTVNPLIDDIYNGKDGDGKDLEFEYWCAECHEKKAEDI